MKSNEDPYYPAEKSDDTHLSPKDATEISKIVVLELKKLDFNLKKYLK